MPLKVKSREHLFKAARRGGPARALFRPVRCLVALAIVAGVLPVIIATAPPAAATATWSAVVAGGDFSCGLISGAAYCWGSGSTGALGNGGTANTSSPTLVSGGLTFTSIAAGWDDTCALTAAGVAYCWGLNVNGEVGDGFTTQRNVPTAVTATNGPWSSISTWKHETCAIKSSNSAAYCWGLNASGQVGDNGTTQRAVPTLVAGGNTYSKISVGADHVCAIKIGTNAAYCWGSGGGGRLGNGGTAQKLVPTIVSGATTYSQISAGSEDSCALTAAGAAWCWGLNSFGAVGDNSQIERDNPTAVTPTNGPFSSISQGIQFTCAVKSSNGTAWCWGDNRDGQLGDGTTTDKYVPTAAGALAFSSISASPDFHTCGLTTGNAVYCWGLDNLGQVGNGSAFHATPTLVSGGLALSSISTGTNFACALTTAGAAYCWGLNSTGQLGDTTTTQRTVPTAVSGGITFSSIAAGTDNACGLTSAGVAYCWGKNANGQIGDTTTTERDTPTAVSGSLTFTSISVGFDTTCGLITGGAAYCWGLNANGQAGDTTVVEKHTPTAVAGGFTYARISAGYQTTCATHSSTGRSYCWGLNTNSQIGDGGSTEKHTPTVGAATTAFSGISEGHFSTCTVATTGGAGYCWGKNNVGQGGNGGNTEWTSAHAVSGGLFFSSISIGALSTCAIRLSNSAAYCWGSNTGGQVGDGSLTARTAPVAVSGGLTFAGISSAESSVCGVTTGNVAYCWGDNTNGQIGNGTSGASPANTFTPQLVDDPAGTNTAPNAPTSPAQYRSDGTTSITTGGYTNQTTVVIKATVGDPDTSDTDSLCVEMQPIGTGFSGTETSCGSPVAQGTTASNTMTVVNGTQYHWQVRTKDAGGLYSSTWTSFNSGSAAFTVDTTAPGTPSALAQYKSDGTTLLTTGAWTPETTVIASATVTDNASSVGVCIEIQPIATTFLNADSFCGTSVSSGSTASVTATLSDATEYHWQARSKDAAGNYSSSWLSYGGNAETARDVGTDTTAPTGGTVFDGASAGVDSGFNSGSLSTLSANWSGFNTNVSGLASYDYAVGTTSGGTDIQIWTSAGTATSAAPTALVLRTSMMYYVSVRAIDNAGNTSAVVTSNGQLVAPTLTVSVAPGSFTFDGLNVGNAFTSTTRSVVVTTSLNAYNGYVVRQFATSALATPTGQTVPFYAAPYTAPTTWSGTGFGYTTSDTTIQGSGDVFAAGTKYAGLTLTQPGDIVADHTPSISGTAISNETFTLTYKVAVPNNQPAGAYAASIILNVSAIY